ncbi:MAG: alpha/beta-type small acid-soluble spore protein [Acutalibacteraceae bacterium]|nr:alpha/beta-type small acid-soluble spore protein [Acutalibacteraceae bacterium]
MASRNNNMPAENKNNAKQILNQVKMEAAQEVGVDLKKGYNGDLTSRQAGSIGGQMVKKMIKAYEEGNV